MTEAEWLNSVDVIRMLRCLRDRASARKLRLFSCACCRQLWSRLPDARNRTLVESVEQNPLGSFDDAAFRAIIVGSSSGEQEWRTERAYWAVKYLGRSFYKATPLECVVCVALNTALALRGSGDVLPVPKTPELASLLREVMGNPFRSIRVDSSWLWWHDRAVEKLGAAISSEQRWDLLPILGDALEEAGCDSPEMLNHCRAEGSHTCGCWVVDLVLGRE
jgi:hypothetical protein